MNVTDEGRDRADEAEGQDAQEEAAEWRWTRPNRSDQAPGEETVQVNDPYVGDDPPPREEPSPSDDQHQTGG
jgi:hypothetical protein